MTTEIKRCADCAHARPSIENVTTGHLWWKKTSRKKEWLRATCALSQNHYPAIVSPIHSQFDAGPKKGLAQYCGEARGHTRNCGPEGNLWERKS